MSTSTTKAAASPGHRDGPYSELANKLVRAASGIDYAYRDTCSGASGGVPLVLLNHFRGNLDNWDPALVDGLAANRRVIAFDNTGVGGSTGVTPDTIGQMARDAIAFISAVGCEQVNLLGFSIGSFVAQEIALTRPAMVRRVILASSAPQGAAGMHGWAPAVIDVVGKPDVSADEYIEVFFTSSPSSRKAGQQTVRRQYARTENRDAATTWATREAQYDAVCTWGIPDHGALQRVAAIEHPVFVANGDSDPMIPAALLLPARGPDPAGPGEGLPRLGARVPVPALRRVRRRRRGIPQRPKLTARRGLCAQGTPWRSRGQRLSSLTSSAARCGPYLIRREDSDVGILEPLLISIDLSEITFA